MTTNKITVSDWDEPEEMWWDNPQLQMRNEEQGNGESKGQERSVQQVGSRANTFTGQQARVS